MVSGQKGLGDDGPCAGLVLDSVIAAAEIDLDTLSLRGTYLEHYGIVSQDLRKAVGVDIGHGRISGGKLGLKLLQVLGGTGSVHEIHHFGKPGLHKKVDAVTRALDEVEVGHDALLLHGLIQLYSLAVRDDVVLGAVENDERRVGRIQVSDGVDRAEQVVLAGIVHAEQGLLGRTAPGALPLALHVQQVDGTGPVADAVDCAAERRVRSHGAFQVDTDGTDSGLLDIAGSTGK